MKKIKVLLISLFAVFAFVSCGGGEETSSSEETPISESVSINETSEIVSENVSEKVSEAVTSSSQEESETPVVSSPEISVEENSEPTSFDNPTGNTGSGQTPGTSEDIIGGVNVGQIGEGDIIDWEN